MEQTQDKTQEAPTVKAAMPVDISSLSEEQKDDLLRQLNAQRKDERTLKREAYEKLRSEFMGGVREKLTSLIAEVRSFHQWLEKESEAFTCLMREYGEVRRDEQMSYTITEGDFRLGIKSNKVKGFDERADLAAERLVAFLKGYMQQSEKGTEDPMYQLAMTLLERNQAGDLDYKSISKLYELEDKFGDSEYSGIMSLFKESNVVQKTALNYYFWHRDKETGVWLRLEPSFCRL